MKDLAPEIHRQRLIIEGLREEPITPEQISVYLKKLSEVLGMRSLTEPVTHKSEKFGWAGWIHWETSGTHFYAWDQPRIFFSIDIYTCKAFKDEDAIHFTKEFFGVQEVEFKSV